MQAIPREIPQNNWIVILFVFGFVLLFLMKVFQPSRLVGYSLSFFTKGFIEKRTEEKFSIFSIFHTLLFTYCVLSLSIFFYSINIYNTGSFSFLIIFLAVTVYLIIRYFIDFYLSKLLGVSNYLRYFIFTKVGYLYTLSIWLFPVLIIYFFGFKNNLFLWLSFFILLLVRFSLVFYNNKKLILNHFFYFILYLCTLEIAPLLILLKITKEAYKI